MGTKHQLRPVGGNAPAPGPNGRSPKGGGCEDVAASRGVGVYELDGAPPGVLKVYWATPEGYIAHAR